MLFQIILIYDIIAMVLELPETSFTRSISNPEAVMRRRRQQKLEKKLQQFRSKDGGPDTGKNAMKLKHEISNPSRTVCCGILLSPLRIRLYSFQVGHWKYTAKLFVKMYHIKHCCCLLEIVPGQ